MRTLLFFLVFEAGCAKLGAMPTCETSFARPLFLANADLKTRHPFFPNEMAWCHRGTFPSHITCLPTYLSLHVREASSCLVEHARLVNPSAPRRLLPFHYLQHQPFWLCPQPLPASISDPQRSSRFSQSTPTSVSSLSTTLLQRSS